MKIRISLLVGGFLLLWGCRQPPTPDLVVLDDSSPTPAPIGIPFVTLPPATAVVIEMTPTPLPTPSSTPTPTPIVYVIDAGDTLLALAWQRGNTLEDILALNPGIRPELLQIGQQIVLPPPATPMAQAAASTPVPLQLAVVQLQTYRTPVNSLWLLGEVHNAGTVPVENVQMEIGLRDEMGNLVGTAVTWVAASVIPVEGRAPFGVLLPEIPAGFSYPTVAIVGGQSVQDMGTRYLGIVGQEIAVSHDGELAQATGKVINAGDATATTVRLILTLYDSQGFISGFAQQLLDGPLLPGENTPFAFRLALPGGEPVSAHLLVNALRQEDE